MIGLQMLVFVHVVHVQLCPYMLSRVYPRGTRDVLSSFETRNNQRSLKLSCGQLARPPVDVLLVRRTFVSRRFSCPAAGRSGYGESELFRLGTHVVDLDGRAALVPIEKRQYARSPVIADRPKLSLEQVCESSVVR
jgi:hypothetical protein